MPSQDSKLKLKVVTKEPAASIEPVSQWNTQPSSDTLPNPPLNQPDDFMVYGYGLWMTWARFKQERLDRVCGGSLASRKNERYGKGHRG